MGDFLDGLTLESVQAEIRRAEELLSRDVGAASRSLGGVGSGMPAEERREIIARLDEERAAAESMAVRQTPASVVRSTVVVAEDAFVWNGGSANCRLFADIGYVTPHNRVPLSLSLTLSLSLSLAVAGDAW